MSSSHSHPQTDTLTATTMSRAPLYLKTWIFRFFQTIGRYCDLYLSLPLPLRPRFTLHIPSPVSSVPGSFDLLFYGPESYKPFSSPPSQKRPVLLNFHGGGYTIGHAADDARWATEVVKRTGAVVVSVNYRLAPRHPFPTGIEDCVSAVLYLWRHAEELGLDISRTAFSGFSAGGNFCFAAAYKLHSELQRLKEANEITETEIGKLVSIVAFYPAVDWTKSRTERNASNPNAVPIVPAWLRWFSAFEDSYLFPKPDMYSPLLSPGLAPDGFLRDRLPENMVMVTCWSDGLLVEGERFRKRLQAAGKRVDGEMVEGVPHGWDKWPSVSSRHSLCT